MYGAAPRDREAVMLLAVVLVAVVVSGIGPHDRLTWFMEVLPIFIAAPILAATYRRFPLTPFVYRLILIHALILALGAHYTYARVPLGLWLQDAFELSRNHYDRLGHFAQGFIPAMAAREILLRVTVLRRGKMLFFLVVCVCLAASAFYEFIEWWAALLYGESATAFLAMQGDVWDTQKDMFAALLGAVAAQLLLAGRHDAALARGK